MNYYIIKRQEGAYTTFYSGDKKNGAAMTTTALMAAKIFSGKIQADRYAKRLNNTAYITDRPADPSWEVEKLTEPEKFRFIQLQLINNEKSRKRKV